MRCNAPNLPLFCRCFTSPFTVFRLRFNHLFASTFRFACFLFSPFFRSYTYNLCDPHQIVSMWCSLPLSLSFLSLFLFYTSPLVKSGFISYARNIYAYMHIYLDMLRKGCLRSFSIFHLQAFLFLSFFRLR